MWSHINQHISDILGQEFNARQQRSVGGGCINQAFVIEDNNDQFFVKLNDARKIQMFEAEYAGLSEIVASNTLAAPTPLCYGIAGTQAYLVMEYRSTSAGNKQSHRQLGQQLAQMHQITNAEYGWTMDNTIGSTPQINKQSDNWLTFWREHRLGYQIELAAQRGFTGQLQTKGLILLNELDFILDGHQPAASLLHGDLWSGNYAINNNGAPFVFDPAVYYGDRETDLAMTELFGGFSADFYDAYNESLPLSDGYKTRKTLYNLYHILNHLNLFGGAYLSQAQQMIELLLSKMGVNN